MNRKLLVTVIAAVFVLAVGTASYLAFRPQPIEVQPESSAPAGQTATPSLSLTLAKKVEFPGVKRPEIVVTDSRVFVVYLEPVNATDYYFKVLIYDRDLSTEIAAKTLVSTTPEYGHPTDMRVVNDGSYVYAFYETVDRDVSYLFGAKYTMDDAFERVAYTGPIASDAMFRLQVPGDEKLDDPAPMLDGDSIYVMTRYKSSMAAEGETRFRMRGFDLYLNPLSEFDLDLSACADGEGRQTSIISDGGFYYVVTPTTSGVGQRVVELVQWTVPEDILMVQLDRAWNVVESKVIAAEPGYTEGYVSGLAADSEYFYVTYNQVILDREFTSVVKVFDRDWNQVARQKLKDGNSARPSIFVTTDRVYAGYSDHVTEMGEVYIFEKKGS